jgi:hypothetical protein
MLARDEDTDYDTPVERVADPKREELRDRIASRTAALQGKPNDPEESEGAELDGAAVPGSQPVEGDPTPSTGGCPAPRAGDPWMRRLHAVATERGMDHDALHDWAVEHFHVDSLKDLSTPQRATFMELVERMPLMDTSAPPVAGQDAPASEEGGVRSGAPLSESDAASGASIPPGSATPTASDSPPVTAPSAAPFTDPATLETYAAAVLGFDEPQPLKALTPADFDQVWDALGLSELSAYQEWYPKQGRTIRAVLMTAKQSPTARREAAKAAAKGKPDAETLREGLES